ncbi:23S rRNA (pseudouridine(1915)-N(3))-methyltransferase RlmH [Verrucomicrobiota bacterium sgz303538]
MHWRILAIGKPKLSFARAGIEEYASRLQPFAPVQIDYLKASGREAESTALLERSEGLFRVVLDERGAEVTSRSLADKVTSWEHSRAKGVAILIGGADGHTPELRASAGWLWSLSKLTLQHELALVVMLEQLYRAYTIKGGMPYHRD